MASREAEFASRPGWRDICRPARVGDERSCPPFSNVGAICGKPLALQNRQRLRQDRRTVGFDDVPEAAYLYPPLTTVRQDFAALGELMMQKVLVAVEEPDSVTEDTPLPTHLIVRQSTGAPRNLPVT